MKQSDSIQIDGRLGEGGGQVLRTSLSLAAALGIPMKVRNVRGGRKKPGVLRQHRACARAVAEITRGSLVGDELGSRDLEFRPGGPPRGGEYAFAVGSAGSTMLVLQTVLPPLLLADGPSAVTIEGGTHNPAAPPFESIVHAFLPCLARSGVCTSIELERPGFVPVGGGKVRLIVEPVRDPKPLVLEASVGDLKKRLVVRIQGLSDDIAEREWIAFSNLTHWPRSCLDIVRTEGPSPGNAVTALLEGQDAFAAVTAFGSRAMSSERVGKAVARGVHNYTRSGEPVDLYLADQLMLPMALMAGGRYRTGVLSRHAKTNAEVIEEFLPGAVRTEEIEGSRAHRVIVRGFGSGS